MVGLFLQGFLDFIASMLTLLLSPIDTLITTYLPSFSNVLESVNSFITYVLGFIPWVLSWVHMPAILLEFIMTYLIAKISITVVAHEFKIILAWYRKLMP